MHRLYFAFITVPLFNMVVCVVLGQIYFLASHPSLPVSKVRRFLLGFLSYLKELKRRTRRPVGTSLRLNPNRSSICLSTVASSINSEALRITNGYLVHLLSISPPLSYYSYYNYVHAVPLSLAADWQCLCQLGGAVCSTAYNWRGDGGGSLYSFPSF